MTFQFVLIGIDWRFDTSGRPGVGLTMQAPVLTALFVGCGFYYTISGMVQQGVNMHCAHHGHLLLLCRRWHLPMSQSYGSR